MIAKILSTAPWVRRASLAGLGASLLPSLSFGLGLGDIQIESHLNQPLYARVEVVDVSDDDWRQIRVRIAPRTLLSEGALHPEVLESLTLRAIEDNQGRHFIEVKSGEVLTEPLFDLPVAVAGQSLQVVRTYSVLLDPAITADSPRATPAAAVVARSTDAGRPPASGAASGQSVAVAKVDAQAHAARRHRSHRTRKHSHVSRKLASPGAAPPAQATVNAAKASGQDQLEGQLAALQQTLTKMQATIASQDVEIAKLTAQVAARTGSAAPRPSTWVEYPARKSAASSEDAGDAPTGWLRARRVMFYWIGGAIVGSVVLVLGVVGFRRWRHARMLRGIALHEAARRQSPSRPTAEPTSDRDLLAWQSNLRAAQSGTWKQSLQDTFDPTSRLSGAQASAPDSQSPAAPAAPASATEDTVAMTVAMEELTQDLEADLESLTASYEAEHLGNAGGGVAAWRAQNEMLERDYLSDTEAMPYVLEAGNQAKVVDEGPDQPGAGRSSEPVGARNWDVAEILEQSLDFDPDRVDIQLKLLEIYHQEALGNRDNFDSLLRKLEAAAQQLSPAQQRRVEMLQRTLREGKHASDGSELITDVAI
ncbi:MAG TPA: hypothetical protein VI653_17645 [Steroidobacteraceae bacterium]